jgi:hypothetical protein
VSPHDLQPSSPGRGGPPGRRVDDLGRLAEIQWTDRAGRDYAECLRPAAVVVEPVNRAPRNTQRLPRTNVDLFSVDSPGQHSVDTNDRLFIMVLAMRRSGQALCAGTLSSNTAMLPFE